METNKPGASQCVACLEPIRPGAWVCPHCGSGQTQSLWQKISGPLKWIGGFMTVMSLVAGVKALNDNIRQAQAQQDAVNELVGAAEWLVRTDNHRQAWDMYAQANAMMPGSVQVRQGQYAMAIDWIQHFGVAKQEAGAILDDLTAVLYRSLPGAEQDEIATVLAHVAKIQRYRLYYEVPVFVDAEKLLDQALAAAPKNVHANAFLGELLLRKTPAQPEYINRAQGYFTVALAHSSQRGWVREAQVSGLAARISGSGSRDELGRVALKAFLQTSLAMIAAGEPPLDPDLRTRVLDSYGHMGRADRIEERIDLIDPVDHLAVIAWLRQGLDYHGRGPVAYVAQLDYLVARLSEAAGDQSAALAAYQQLLQQENNQALDLLVDQGIERLTGVKPPRALQRTYVDDVPDAADPWFFHADTLRHFNPLWQTENLRQALHFFHEAVDARSARLGELLELLPPVLERVRERIFEGDERARVDDYDLSFSIGHHNIARRNWTELMLIYGAALRAGGLAERALPVFGDALAFARSEPDVLDDMAARSAYQLALTFSQRALADDRADDRQEAIANLRLALDLGLVRADLADWSDLKGEAFAALRNEPDYQELIRGR